MSETQEGYGAQSTPDMGESYPPQTGDLLGSYIARLSARVRELEAASTEQSAYQRSMETRIEELESKFDEMDANENTMFERLNEVQEHVGHWFNNDVENRIVALEARVRQCEGYNAYMATLTERLTALESKQEQAATVLSEQFQAAAQAAKPDFWERLSASDRTVVRMEEQRIADSMKPEQEAHAVTTPDHIVDANKKVCATCGHAPGCHVTLYPVNSLPQKWCNGGTLGKPCKCRSYKPVASEG